MNRIGQTEIWKIIATLFVATLPVCVLLESGRAMTILLPLVLAYIVPAILYLNSRYRSELGFAVMSVAFVVETVFLAINMQQLTVDLGSVESPFLLHDARAFYDMAQAIASNSEQGGLRPIPYMGYSLFIALFMKLGICDIAIPIVFNIFAILCTLLLTARLVYFVVDEKYDVNRISSYAMLLVALVPGFMATGPVLQKDVFVTFSLLACVCSVYAIKQRYKLWKYVPIFVIAILILSYVRATYLLVLMLFTVVVWACEWRRKDIIPFLLIGVVQVAMCMWGMTQSWWGNTSYVEMYVSQNEQVTFLCGESQEPLGQLIGPYNTYPLWLKVLLLPITVGVQFMIPFPFTTVTQEFGMPISCAWHRLSYLWYFAAIPMLAYYIFYWWRKTSGGLQLSLLALLAAVSYCIPAFVTAGSVSRYAFCFVPYLAVVGGYVAWRVLHYNKREAKPVGVFAAIYAILIVVALYIGAHPQLII